MSADSSIFAWVGFSGLIGGLIAMGSAHLTNKSNDRRLKAQLKHDADQKEKDRLAELQRDIYLRFLAEIVNAETSLSGLVNRDFDGKEPFGLSGLNIAANQTMLVARTDTAFLASDLLTEYAKIWNKLAPSALKLSLLRGDLKVAEDLRKQFADEVGRALSERRRLQEANLNRPDLHAALERTIEFESKRRDEQIDIQIDISKKSLSELLAFMESLVSELEGIADLKVRTLTAIRGELGGVQEVSAFKAQMQKNMQALNDSMEGFKAELRATIAEE